MGVLNEQYDWVRKIYIYPDIVARNAAPSKVLDYRGDKFVPYSKHFCIFGNAPKLIPTS